MLYYIMLPSVNCFLELSNAFKKKKKRKGGGGRGKVEEGEKETKILHQEVSSSRIRFA